MSRKKLCDITFIWLPLHSNEKQMSKSSVFRIDLKYVGSSYRFQKKYFASKNIDMNCIRTISRCVQVYFCRLWYEVTIAYLLFTSFIMNLMIEVLQWCM